MTIRKKDVQRTAMEQSIKSLLEADCFSEVTNLDRAALFFELAQQHERLAVEDWDRGDVDHELLADMGFSA